MRRTLLILAVVGLCASSASAQGVMRRGSKSIQSGDVTDVTATEVTVTPTIGKKDPIKIPANEILYVQYRGEPPGVSLARSDEKGGRYEKAMDGFKSGAAAASADPPGMKTELQWGAVRMLAKIAMADSAQANAAVAELEKFKKAHPTHYASFTINRYLADVYFAKKDYDKSKAAYLELAKAPWKDSQLAAEIGQAQILLQTNNLDEAAAGFEKVITGAGPAEESSRLAALLGKAKVLTAQAKFAEATPILEEVLAKSPPEETTLQAEAYVRQGDCLQAQGKSKEALLAFLHVDLLFEAEAGLHAEALYNLSKLWRKDNNVDRAQEAVERLQQKYPASDWTKKAISS